mgnify:CR=1 FL=1
MRTVAWSIPMTTRFRQITVREGLLLHGDAGWGEFSPFLDYSGDELVGWLAAAIEACRLYRGRLVVAKLAAPSEPRQG